jgi:glycosyltransferase involved in cell wall biosynthesis
MLTICIPTYNRTDKVRQRILELLPQLASGVKIIVIDNSSVIPVSSAIGDLIERNENVSVIKNKFNIGMSANIARCIEVCNTEWMWLLGDDDEVLPQAVQIILDDISSVNNEISCLKYSSYCGINKEEEILSFSEFLQHRDLGFNFVANTFLISSSVIRVGDIVALDKVMDTSNSMIPHVVLMFQLLMDGGKIFLSKRELVISTESDISWSILQLDFNLIMVMQFASGIDDQHFKLLRNFFSHIVFKPTSIFLRAHRLTKIKGRQYTKYMYKGIFLHSMMRRFRPVPFILNFVFFSAFYLGMDKILPFAFTFLGKTKREKYKNFMS